MTSLEGLVVQGSLYSYQGASSYSFGDHPSSVIKNLVRKSTGGALNLGRDEEMKRVDGGVAGTQTKAGRHT